MMPLDPSAAPMEGNLSNVGKIPRRRRDSRRRPRATWRPLYADVEAEKEVSADEIDAAHALFALANRPTNDTAADATVVKHRKRARSTREADARVKQAASDSAHSRGDEGESDKGVAGVKDAARPIAAAAAATQQAQPPQGGAAPQHAPPHFALHAAQMASQARAAEAAYNGMQMPHLPFLPQGGHPGMPMLWQRPYGDALAFAHLNGGVDPRHYAIMAANMGVPLHVLLDALRSGAFNPQLAAMGLMHAQHGAMMGGGGGGAAAMMFGGAGHPSPRLPPGPVNASTLRCARHVHIAHLILAQATSAAAAKDGAKAAASGGAAAVPGQGAGPPASAADTSTDLDEASVARLTRNGGARVPEVLGGIGGGAHRPSWLLGGPLNGLDAGAMAYGQGLPRNAALMGGAYPLGHAGMGLHIPSSAPLPAAGGGDGLDKLSPRTLAHLGPGFAGAMPDAAALGGFAPGAAMGPSVSAGMLPASLGMGALLAQQPFLRCGSHDGGAALPLALQQQQAALAAAVAAAGKGQLHRMSGGMRPGPGPDAVAVGNYPHGLFT